MSAVTTATRTVVGADGRRGGWALAVVAGTPERAEQVSWESVPGQSAAGARAVLQRCRELGAAAVAVDAPIGLPSDGWRPVDLLMKRRLGRGSARVFLAPPRAVLAEPTYADARRTCREVTGKGLSAQAYGIRGVVLALDEALTDGSPDAAWGRAHVAEVHPELALMALAGRPPRSPLPPKRTAEGRAERLALLGGWVVGRAEEALAAVPAGDDHLDALAAAWSATRWAAGIAEVLGGDLDDHGLPMRVVV